MPRARRDRRVFNAAGVEVFITQVCTRCGAAKPLASFGLRLVGGKLRSIPQCSPCRSGATISPARGVVVQAEVA
jgi:ribosomal protein S27AE